MPASPAQPGPHAIFLSYARDDTDAALRIVAALRAAGIEVWFDQNELRGGDAWDSKIKKQIQSCALFVPIVSQHTEQREEGYFRREWNLAVNRTLDMAHDKAFLLPVVVDATAEATARVPEKFLEVQWTRLPGGDTSAEFVELVNRLLAGPTTTPFTRPARHATDREGKPAVHLWAIVALATALVAVLAYAVLRPSGKEAPAKSTADAKTPSPAPAANDKSIAVLPFKLIDAEEDKGNKAFADGLHDDLLTNLQNIRQLRIVSRGSVLPYRATTKSTRQIAQELGVAYLLTGATRRQGAKVRVSAQLIEAHTDTQIWALPAADHDLNDLFGIQSVIATEIATKLAAVISPEERRHVEHAPTASIAAYDLFHEARATVERLGANLDGFTQAEKLLEQAVELDQNFAPAWGQLALYLLRHDDQRRDFTGARREQAQRAIDLMERLAPDRPESLVALAAFYHRLPEFARAEGYARKAAEALPANGEAALQLGEMEKNRGHFAEALAQFRRAQLLDARSPDIRRVFQDWLLRLRRFDEAAAVERTDPYSIGYNAARLPFYATGSTAELVEWEKGTPNVDWLNSLIWRWIVGDAAGYLRICDAARAAGRILPNNDETKRAFALMALGYTAGARTAAQNYIDRARKNRDLSSRLTALNFALLGEKESALQSVEAYLAIAREKGANLDLSSEPAGKAVVLTWVGEKEKAIAEIARLLRVPSGLNVHELRCCPYWQPLQGEPEFEKLLADPKNNAPLF